MQCVRLGFLTPARLRAAAAVSPLLMGSSQQLALLQGHQHESLGPQTVAQQILHWGLSSVCRINYIILGGLVKQSYQFRATFVAKRTF